MSGSTRVHYYIVHRGASASYAFWAIIWWLPTLIVCVVARDKVNDEKPLGLSILHSRLGAGFWLYGVTPRRSCADDQASRVNPFHSHCCSDFGLGRFDCSLERERLIRLSSDQLFLLQKRASTSQYVLYVCRSAHHFTLEVSSNIVLAQTLPERGQTCFTSVNMNGYRCSKERTHDVHTETCLA